MLAVPEPRCRRPELADAQRLVKSSYALLNIDFLTFDETMVHTAQHHPLLPHMVVYK